MVMPYLETADLKTELDINSQFSVLRILGRRVEFLSSNARSFAALFKSVERDFSAPQVDLRLCRSCFGPGRRSSPSKLR